MRGQSVLLMLGCQVGYDQILMCLVLIQQEWQAKLRLDVRGCLVVVLLTALCSQLTAARRNMHRQRSRWLLQLLLLLGWLLSEVIHGRTKSRGATHALACSKLSPSTVRAEPRCWTLESKRAIETLGRVLGLDQVLLLLLRLMLPLVWILLHAQQLLVLLLPLKEDLALYLLNILLREIVRT